LISGLSDVHARIIEESRGEEMFASLEDFRRRTRLPQAVIVRLAKADAFASFAIGRRKALWNALAPKENLPLLAGIEVHDERDLALPDLLPEEEVIADYKTLKLSLRAHPFSFLREKLDAMRVVPAAGLADYPERRPLKVAGLVLLRQQPSTAKGIRFVTLEDETGTINLVVRPDVWERYHRPANRATAFLVHGQVERKNEIIHVLTHRIEDLTPLLGGVHVASRDFR
jgi:error-prone DNA polymerase